MEGLPEDIAVDILSRLPVKTIIHCKCVRKKWRILIFSSNFINLHLSRSPRVFMIQCCIPQERMFNVMRWVEIKDELDQHNLRYEPVMNFDLKLVAPFPNNTCQIPMGSVNGLICVLGKTLSDYVENIYVCNPTIREYMILPNQPLSRDGEMMACGFGVGLLTGEYKVLRAKRGVFCDSSEVYTLGTGEWRSVGYRGDSYKLKHDYGLFLNGFLHWISDCKSNFPGKLITFDIDNETYQLFPAPPTESEAIQESRVHMESLGVLKGFLCKSDTYDYVFTFWVMKEYGIEKSWHKEVVINQALCHFLDWPLVCPVCPVECLEDGSILMTYSYDKTYVYCSRSETMTDLEDLHRFCSILVHRPSFYRLQNFDSERVHMF